MRTLMNETQIEAIWHEINFRTDVLKVTDLHYIKITHPSIDGYYLITWDMVRREVTVAKTHHVCSIDDHPASLEKFEYVCLKTPEVSKQVLLKLYFDPALCQIKVEPIFHPEDDEKQLTVLTI